VRSFLYAKKGEIVMEKTKAEKTMSGIMVFTIQRPNVRNAIDYDVMDDLNEIIDKVSNDPSCKALIITGSGEEAVCSGGDLSVFNQLHTKEDAHTMLSKMGHILYRLMTLNRPTVALFNGIAIGGGIELATACDFRIARSGTRFGFVQGRLAITTGWGGDTILFEKLPYDKACHLLYSAQTYSVEWRAEQGFVHHVINETNWREEGIYWIENMIQHSLPEFLFSYKEMAVRNGGF
jgi:enoyl-CoA hydratase